MFEVFLNLQSYGYGTALGEVLNQWAAIGVFDFILPFLLLFAIIYGILNITKIFKNKSVESIIALSVSLMALQFDFVSVFFSQIFPRLGVALSIILVILILVGFFVDPSKPGIMYTLLGISAVIALIVLISTSNSIGWWTSTTWWSNNWLTVIFSIAVLAAIGIIVNSNSGSPAQSYKLGPFRSDR